MFGGPSGKLELRVWPGSGKTPGRCIQSLSGAWLPSGKELEVELWGGRSDLRPIVRNLILLTQKK